MARFSPYELDEYVLEKLPVNKKITLECELEEDNQLVNEVEKRKRVIDSIKHIGRETLLEEFENWNIDTNSHFKNRDDIDKKEKKEFSIHPVFSYLIVFIIIGAVFLITDSYDPTKNFTPQRAYEFYFEPMNVNVVFPKKKDTEFTDERKAALKKYQEGDYEGAIQDMNNYLDMNENDAIIHLYSGIAYLTIGQKETGIQRLIYTGNRDQSLQHYTNWFIALAYMNPDQLEESREYLQRVTDQGGYYAGKARELFRISGKDFTDREIEQF